MKKIIIGLIIVIVIILGIAAFGHTQKTPPLSSDTTELKTFTSEKYGFEFSYPSSIEKPYTLCPSEGDGRDCAPNEVPSPLYLIVTNPEPGKEPRSLIMLEAWNNEEARGKASWKINESVKAFAEEVWRRNAPEERMPEKMRTDLKRATIDGQEAYEFMITHTYESPSGGSVIYEQSTVLIFSNNDIAYLLLYPTKYPISKQIVDSFKFK